jgi:hypothetical protein
MHAVAAAQIDMSKDKCGFIADNPFPAKNRIRR